MATKRRTEHEHRPPRQPEPAVEAVEAVEAAAAAAAAAADGPTPGAEEDLTERRAEELAARLDEANSRHLRLAADFDNYKKRARQEQVDTMRYAAATVAERLLPVL